jgi:translation initiation factor 4B
VPNNPPYTAYIGNLPYDKASEEALDEYFGDLGIEEIRIVKDNESGRPKGYAYIQFTHREGLENALCADGEVHFQEKEGCRKGGSFFFFLGTLANSVF